LIILNYSTPVLRTPPPAGDNSTSDFMFEMNDDEFKNLRYHFGTSNWGGTRYTPMVFTEQGLAMLSSVLRSKRVIEVNILIMRAFVRMRELLYSDKNLALKIEQLEKQMYTHGKSLKQVIQIINKLMLKPEPKPQKIGFQIDNIKT